MFIFDLLRLIIYFKSHAESLLWNLKGQAAWLLKMGPIVCAETSKTNCQSTLRNISEEQRRNLNSVGSPKSRRIHSSLNFHTSNFATILNLLYRPV